MIFDEAHHLRNTDTRSHALARFICERSEAAVFLTATPLQTSLEDIVHLMEALGVDVAADPRLLEEQILWDMELNDWIRLARRRPPGWRAETNCLLHRLDVSGGGDRPGWERFKELAATSDFDDMGQRAVVVDAARDLQALSPYMTRTLRSDVDEDRPTREAITRTVQFSLEEKAFYQAIYRVCLGRAREKGTPPGFITQMPERRTASCAPAVAAEILRYAVEDEEDEDTASFSPAEVSVLGPFARGVLDLPDQKLEALCEILAHAFGDLTADRVMIFSTFRGTLRYLASALTERGYSLELMYGPTPARDEDCRRGEKSRERIAAEFRQGKFEILLASEVAGEGLDFEHCHFLINYDLPWNPMRVEQRIGRCDRIGQRSDKVYVTSFASVGTIEERILSRLYERLHIFERALGDLEVILGAEIAAFERDVFRRDLSPRQQEERLERISQTMENRERQRESVGQSSVISAQGRQLIELDQQEIKEAESGFLSPQEVAQFVHASLIKHLPNSVKEEPAENAFEISANRDLRDALQELLRDYPTSHYARTEIVRFRKALDDRHKVRVSFSEPEEEAEFAHARHPLVLLGRRLSRRPVSDIPYCCGEARSIEGNEQTMLVWAVGSLEGYTNHAELVCTAMDCATGSIRNISVSEAHEWTRALKHPGNGPQNVAEVRLLLAKAEQALFVQFEGITTTFTSRNNLLTEKARQAVRSYAQRKLGWLRQQLSREDIHDNIRNLYSGWSRRIESETKTKLERVEQRSRIKSALEIIGIAVLCPSYSESGTQSPVAIDLPR